MIESWPELVQKTIDPPQNIPETVDRLVTVLEDEHKAAIAAMQEEDLIHLHFSLGRVIRNALGLWEPRSPLLSMGGANSPDEASDQIIHALWHRLNHQQPSKFH